MYSYQFRLHVVLCRESDGKLNDDLDFSGCFIVQSIPVIYSYIASGLFLVNNPYP